LRMETSSCLNASRRPSRRGGIARC
jgi:hypothetical protein